MIDLREAPFNAVFDGPTDVSEPLQAAIDSLVPFGGGKILIPGHARIGSPVIVGDRLGNAFTSISLVGEGQLCSSLTWMGGDATMLKWWRNKYSGASGIGFKNGGAKGSSIGIHATGPGPGTQSNGLTFEQGSVVGFDIGFQAGGGTLGTECASEVKFRQFAFQQNNRGFVGAGSGNTINIWFDACSLTQNTLYGADLGSAQMASFRDGSTNGNGIAAIKQASAWQAQLVIEGMRFELGPTELIADLASGNAVKISNCVAVSVGAAPTYPVINGAPGPLYLLLQGNTFGSQGQSGWIPYGGLVQQGTTKLVEMVGNRIYGPEPFKISANDTGMNGMGYEFRGNTCNGVRQRPEAGVVAWPNRIAA